MAKPGTLFTWATDANYAAGTDPWAATATKVQPTSGKQAGGWLPEEPPPAQYFNWALNLLGQWVSFVNDELRSDTVSVTLSADQNNYNPTGFANCRHLRITSSTMSVLISGFAAQADGFRFIVSVTDASTQDVRLVLNSANSSAANRIEGRAAQTQISMFRGATCDLMYDATDQRWRILGHYAIEV